MNGEENYSFFGCCDYFNIFASRVTGQGTRCSLSKVKTGIHSRVISSEIGGGETELKQVFPCQLSFYYCPIFIFSYQRHTRCAIVPSKQHTVIFLS
jgi:hypothetical protein